MKCELCEVNEASVTIIPTGEGMPMSVCSRCFALQGLELAKTVLDAVEIAERLGPMFVRPPSPEEVANENPPAKPRTRKSKAATEAPEGEAGGSAEAPAASQDG